MSDLRESARSSRTRTDRPDLREEVYEPDTPRRHCDIIIAKQRNGPTVRCTDVLAIHALENLATATTVRA